MANETPASNINVVLVHGAFVDGSGWEGVYRDLSAKGFTVTVVQHPTATVADDVAHVTRAIEAHDGPAILVGHSYGGLVITEAGRHAQVKAPVCRRLGPRCRRIGQRADRPAAEGRSDPAARAAGRLSVRRSGQIPRRLRPGRRSPHGEVPGDRAAPVGARGGRRHRRRAGVEDPPELVWCRPTTA